MLEVKKRGKGRFVLACENFRHRGGNLQSLSDCGNALRGVGSRAVAPVDTAQGVV